MVVSVLVLVLGCVAPEASVEPSSARDSAPQPATPDSGRAPPPAVPLPLDAVDLDPADDVVHVELVADEATFTIGDLQVQGYAYNGQVPGPTIRARRGDTIVVELVNQLDVDTTIHWHGLHVPWAMDGVTWMSAPVAPGERFTYTFELDQAGTYWYHPHFDTQHQVDAGLYGAFVVLDPDDPPVDRDLVFVFDSWLEADDPHAHHGIDGADLEWTANGAAGGALALAAGEVVRARLLNASNTGYLDLRWDDIRHVGSDQGLRSALGTPDRLLLAPGDRADVEWLVGAEFSVLNHPYSLAGGVALGGPELVLSIASDGGPAPDGAAWPFDGAPPSPDPGHADIVYVLQGDPLEDAWFINGEQFPEVTIAEVDLDEDIVIEVRNLSASEHPFHLHGHAFEVLSRDEVPVTEREVEDNINVPIQGSLRLAVRADNPGDWMTHCHVLPHADGGMMTVLRVGEPSEP